MCRRCGAPLPVGADAARVGVPSSLQRRGLANRTAATAVPSSPGWPPTDGASSVPPAGAASAASAAFSRLPADTLLPGAFPRPDNLLPRATRGNAKPAKSAATAATRGRVPSAAAVSGAARMRAEVRNHWRRVIVIFVVAVALTMSVVAVWPVVFTNGGGASGATDVAQETRATSLLRTVVGGARTLYATHHSFANIAPASLSALSYKVPVVGADSNARLGEVSMRAQPRVLIVATPADAQRCVFARDEPSKSSTVFATVTTGNCRASSAPATGWSSR